MNSPAEHQHAESVRCASEFFTKVALQRPLIKNLDLLYIGQYKHISRNTACFGAKT